MGSWWIYTGIALTLCLCYSSATKYKLILKTDSTFLSGTDAQVSLTLRGGGRTSSTKKFPRNHNGFERTKEYHDTLYDSSLDSVFIDSVEVGQDNTGRAPGWKLENLRILDERRQILYTFDCSCWVENCHWVRCGWWGWWWCHYCYSATHVLSNPRVDGRWSDWSSWHNCDKKNGHIRQCRRRYCDSPPPGNNGKKCEGPDVQY